MFSQRSFVYRVVESMYGVNTPNVGSDTKILINFGQPPVPDAWRFDAGGCQGPGQLSLSNSAAGPICPGMGVNPIPTAQFSVNPDGTESLHLSVSYDEFAPGASTRYTIWQIQFDHVFSSPGPTPPDQSTCGGAELNAQLSFDFVDVLTASGQRIDLPGCDALAPRFYCSYLTWNGGIIYYDQPDDCLPVSAQATTWGKLKGMYR
jgi:hypothetical protein